MEMNTFYTNEPSSLAISWYAQKKTMLPMGKLSAFSGNVLSLLTFISGSRPRLATEMEVSQWQCITRDLRILFQAGFKSNPCTTKYYSGKIYVLFKVISSIILLYNKKAPFTWRVVWNLTFVIFETNYKRMLHCGLKRKTGDHNIAKTREKTPPNLMKFFKSWFWLLIITILVTLPCEGAAV